jgi:hypothetical protein
VIRSNLTPGARSGNGLGNPYDDCILELMGTAQKEAAVYAVERRTRGEETLTKAKWPGDTSTLGPLRPQTTFKARTNILRPIDLASEHGWVTLSHLYCSISRRSFEASQPKHAAKRKVVSPEF